MLPVDRKSTRLNSSHQIISYAVFCLKKKKPRFEDVKASLEECKDKDMTYAAPLFVIFLFIDTATTEIYTLSLHDALPILIALRLQDGRGARLRLALQHQLAGGEQDRKSTRLNSSHQIISYAVFCLKKKKNNIMLLLSNKKKKKKKK